MTSSEETIEVGSIIAAPGFESSIRASGASTATASIQTSSPASSRADPLRLRSLLAMSSGSPTARSRRRSPSSSAWASRDTSAATAGARRICMYATKEAIIAKEHAKGLERPSSSWTSGPRQGFRPLRQLGPKRSTASATSGRCPRPSRNSSRPKNLLVTYVLEDGEPREEEFDMVILSVRPDAAEEAACWRKT